MARIGDVRLRRGPVCLFARGPSSIIKSFLGFAALIVPNTRFVVSGRLKLMEMIGGFVVVASSLR